MLPATVLVFCADSSGIQSVNMSRPKQAFVGCSTFTEATHISTPPSLLLRSARYERSDNCFCPLEELTLSLSEAEYLAASGYVACHTTGLLRSFLVLGTENSLVIGRLDLKHSEFESLGKVFLADLGGQEELCGVQGCWLADGPTVVALHQGRVIVAAEREEAHNVFDHDFQLRWKAHILDGQFKRLFVCGDRVLCLSSADIDVSSPPLSRRGQLMSFPLSTHQQLGSYPPALMEVLTPPELDPSLVTCLVYVPARIRLPYNVVYGTSVGKLLFCADSKLFKEIELEDTPLSLQYAVEAHGGPVLVVSLCGRERKVISLCGRTFVELHTWTRVEQAIVSDVARTGYDQLVLLITPGVPSDSLANALQVSQLETAPSNPNDKLKNEVLTSFTKGLQRRLQDGLNVLQAADDRRLDKMDLVTSACNLMQNITVQHSDRNRRPSTTMTDMSNDALFVEAIRLQTVHEGCCYLIIDVKVREGASEGFHLHRPSLFLTTLHGHVNSFSSCLPSPSDCQRFLISFPLKETHLPLHIMFAAEVTIDKTRSSAWDGTSLGFGAQECMTSQLPCIYIQCLDTIEDSLISNPDLFLASSCNLKSLCEKWMSTMGWPTWKHHLCALEVAVSMQIELSSHSLGLRKGFQEGEGDELDTKHDLSPLSRMYARDISLVQHSSFLSHFQLMLSCLAAPRLAEIVCKFLSVMLEERHNSKKEEPGSTMSAELQTVYDRCFCHLLLSITHNTFGHFQEWT